MQNQDLTEHPSKTSLQSTWPYPLPQAAKTSDESDEPETQPFDLTQHQAWQEYHQEIYDGITQLLTAVHTIRSGRVGKELTLTDMVLFAGAKYIPTVGPAVEVLMRAVRSISKNRTAAKIARWAKVSEIDQFSRCLADTLVHLRQERLLTFKSEDLSLFTRVEQGWREIKEAENFSPPRQLALEDVALITELFSKCEVSNVSEVNQRVAKNVTTLSVAFQTYWEELAKDRRLPLFARAKKKVKSAIGFSSSSSSSISTPTPVSKETKETKDSKTQTVPPAILLTFTQGSEKANAWQYTSVSSLASGETEELKQLEKDGSSQLQADYWQERCEERLKQLSAAKKPNWQDIRILLKEMKAYKKALGKSDIESSLLQQFHTVYSEEKTDDRCRKALKEHTRSITTVKAAEALHPEVMEIIDDLIQLGERKAAENQLTYYLGTVNQALEQTKKKCDQLQETVTQKAKEHKQKQIRQEEWLKELISWQEKLAKEQKSVAASEQMDKQKQATQTTTLVESTQTTSSPFTNSVTQAWQTGKSVGFLKTLCNTHYDLWQQQRSQGLPTATLKALLAELTELQSLVSKSIETSDTEQTELTNTEALRDEWKKNHKAAKERYQATPAPTPPTSESPISEYKQVSSEKPDTKASENIKEQKKPATSLSPSQLELVQNIETTLGEPPCGFAVLTCQVVITEDEKAEYPRTVYPPLALLILDPSKSHHPYWRTYAKLLQWHYQCESPRVVDTPLTSVWIATPEALPEHVISASYLGYSKKDTDQTRALFLDYQKHTLSYLQASSPSGVPFLRTYGFHGLRTLFSQPMPVLSSSEELTLDVLDQALLTPLCNFCLQLGLHYGVSLGDLVCPLRILDTLGKESHLSTAFVEDMQAAILWARQKKQAIACGEKIPETPNEYSTLKQYYFHTVQALWQICQTHDASTFFWNLTRKSTSQLDPLLAWADQKLRALRQVNDKEIDSILDLLARIFAHRKFNEEQHQRYLEAIPEKYQLDYLNKLKSALPDDQKKLTERLRHLPGSNGRRLTYEEEKLRWEKALQVLWQTGRESDVKASEPSAFPESVSTLPEADESSPLPESVPASPKAEESLALPTSVPTSPKTHQSPTSSKTEPQLLRLYPTETDGWEVKAHTLRSEIADQLFKKNGEWRDKDSKYPGHHRVYPIVLREGKPPKFWVKIYPEQPALEYLVTELDRRLGIEGTPTFELVKFEHGGQTSAAVLTSAVVEPEPLHTLLGKTPDDLQKKLSPSTFVRVLLRVLLTNPEDDKGEDYFLTGDFLKGDGKLIRIDNERAFFPPSILDSSKKNSRKLFSGTRGTIGSVSSSGFAAEWCNRILMLPNGIEPGVGEHNDPYTIYLCPKSDNITAYWLENGKFVPHNVNKSMQLLRLMKGKKEIFSSDKTFDEITSLCSAPTECLLVKSIIYCLNYMETVVWGENPDIAEIVKDFLSLNPVSVITDLLLKADRLHDGWNKLFNKQEVTDHFNCKDPWSSLPIMCIPKGLARELISRLTTMHTALRLDSTQMTGLQLLKITQPKLAKYYQYAYSSTTIKLGSKDTPQKTKAEDHPINKRFNLLIKPLYQKDTAGHLQSRTPHSLAIQSSLRLESPINSESLPDIRDKKICSAQQELTELEKWKKAHRARLFQDLLARKSTAAIEWEGLSLRHQQLIFKALQKEALANKLSFAQRKFILKAMTNIAWPQLDLRGFEDEVSDVVLANLLKKSGEHLLSLNISNCKLTNESLQNMIRHNPNLQQLHARGIHWSTFDLTHFKHLHYLDLSHSEISTLKGKAPRLRNIQLAHCKQLTQLSARDSKNGRPIQIFDAPQLIELNLNGCENLESLYLPEIFFNGQFGLHITACQSLKEVNFQSEKVWPKIPEFIINLAQTNSTILNAWCAAAAELNDDERVILINKLKQYNTSIELTLEHSGNITKTYKIYKGLELLLLGEMLKRNRTLTCVNLSCNEITDIYVRALAEALVTNHTLTVLNLSGNKITDIGAQALAKMLKTNETLIHLHLSRNKITDIGVQALAEMVEMNKTLTYLDLSVNQITDTGAQVLFDALKSNRNTALTTLILDNNYIGDTGAQALADMLETNKTLTRLILTGNRITDIGVQALAKALKINTTLTELEPHDWSTTSHTASRALKDIKKYLARNQELAKAEAKATPPAPPPQVTTPAPSIHLGQKASKDLSSFNSVIIPDISVTSTTTKDEKTGLPSHSPLESYRRTPAKLSSTPSRQSSGSSGSSLSDNTVSTHSPSKPFCSRIQPDKPLSFGEVHLYLVLPVEGATDSPRLIMEGVQHGQYRVQQYIRTGANEAPFWRSEPISEIELNQLKEEYQMTFSLVQSINGDQYRSIVNELTKNADPKQTPPPNDSAGRKAWKKWYADWLTQQTIPTHPPTHISQPTSIPTTSTSSSEPLTAPLRTITIKGDGNCGFYAFAVGLMENIFAGTLVLDEKQHASFLCIFGQNLLKPAQENAAPEQVKHWVNTHYAQRYEPSIYEQLNPILRMLTSTLVKKDWNRLVTQMLKDVIGLVEQVRENETGRVDMDSFITVFEHSYLKEGTFGGALKQHLDSISDPIGDDTWREKVKTWLTKPETCELYNDGVVEALWASKNIELPLLGGYFGVKVYIDDQPVYTTTTTTTAEIRLVMPQGTHYDYQIPSKFEQKAVPLSSTTDQTLLYEANGEIHAKVSDFGMADIPKDENKTTTLFQNVMPPAMPIPEKDDVAIQIGVFNTYLKQLLENSTTPRRLKQYLNGVVKTLPNENSDFATAVAWLTQKITELEQQTGKQLTAEEAKPLMNYFKRQQVEWQPKTTSTQPLSHDSLILKSPSRSSASLYHPTRIKEEKTQSSIPSVTLAASATPPFGSTFHIAAGKQKMEEIRYTQQSIALLYPHQQWNHTLCLFLHHPVHGVRKYYLTYLVSGRWVSWVPGLGTYFPLEADRADMNNEEAQAKLKPFLAKELPTLATLCQFAEPPSLLCPATASDAFYVSAEKQPVLITPVLKTN